MPDDGWKNATAYERFMGRWSRQLAVEFIAWLKIFPGAHWLEIGCGTGALTQTILDRAQPQSLVACDTAPDFVSYCAQTLPSDRLRVLSASTDSLPQREGGYGAVVSSLVLNFLPHPIEALTRMRQVSAVGGCVAACVWDYSSGMELLHAFWEAAAALDPKARELHEGSRFPICHPDALSHAFAAAGLTEISTSALTIPTVFPSFSDYWSAFVQGAGPAPTYLKSLSQSSREELAERLRRDLSVPAEGSIDLQARAWAVKGYAP